MKILLTGASGFLGSCVLRQLLEMPGVEVAALVRRPGDAWRIREPLQRIRVIPFGLDDGMALAQAVASFRPSHVIHLAWSGVAGRNRNDAAQHVNVFETLRLLDLALGAGASVFVGLGSQAEYGPCRSRIDESTPVHPTTMYGTAKLATALLAERLCTLSGARFAWLRLFSSYGPRDHPEWMLPYLIGELLERRRPAVTAAEQRWDYLFVDDAAAAVVAAARSDSAQGVFNLGSGAAHPLRRIIEMARDEIDPDLPIGFGEVPYRPDQVMHLEADVSRLAAATGWRPKVDLGEGIRRTVHWHRHGDPRS